MYGEHAPLACVWRCRRRGRGFSCGCKSLRRVSCGRSNRYGNPRYARPIQRPGRCLAIFHDLLLDYSDHGICDEGSDCQVSLHNCVDLSVCQPDPIQIPPNVWIRFRFDTDDQNPETWDTVINADGSPAVFYAAVYCRGEAPRGACCPDQVDLPGTDTVCFDDLPVTSCLGHRWLANTTCDENLFDPPCGTHACCLPDGSCDNVAFEECFMTCDTLSPSIECQTDQDCPGERTCGTDTDANRCTPVCAKWSTGKFCSDARFDCPQPCDISDIADVFFSDEEALVVSVPRNCAIDAPSTM